MKAGIAGNNTRRTFGKCGMPPGFSLGEMLAAMTIVAMVLVAVLTIYNRAERSAAAVTRRLDNSRLPREVLQRIAEDLDNIMSTGSDATITIQNKFDNLFPAARMIISRTFLDNASRERKFEEIVWQSSYDYESFVEGLVLYRSHSGIASEDKLLDKGKEDWEKELFVPLCSGVTFFSIKAVKGDKPVDKWSGSPPAGIEVTLSFAEPFKRVNGTLDVPEEEKITRTIAIDRTRKIKFAVAKNAPPSGQEETTEPDAAENEDEKSPPERPKKSGSSNNERKSK
jgi:type II secretory pathway pseudopilin PulG